MKTALRLLTWLFLVLGLVPLGITLWVSFSPDSFLTPPTAEWSWKWYGRFFENPRWSSATLRSLLVAGLSAALSLLLTLPVVLLPLRRVWVSQAILLPLWLPPIILGLGVLPLFQRLGLWGTIPGVVLIHTAMGLPVVWLVLRIGRPRQLGELEQAAKGLGANRRQVFWQITLPLLRPALLTAGLAQFVLSWNEAIVTVFLTTPHSETLPVVMWSQLRSGASPLVAVAGVLSVLVNLLLILVGVLVIRRRPR